MLNRILNQIYPSNCVLCGNTARQSLDICRSCENDLIVNASSCEHCAMPMPQASNNRVCGQCLKKPPIFDATWSAFVYAQPLEWMIQQLKFNAKLSFVQILSQVAVNHLPVLDAQPDCVIPVPLHRKRLKERGFNQALELVKPLANKLKVPIDNRCCRRDVYTVAQTGLDSKDRRRNIKNAFSFNNKNNYKYVVVFDDVITTGSTVSELVKTIKHEGVTRVDVWSLARAVKYINS